MFKICSLFFPDWFLRYFPFSRFIFQDFCSGSFSNRSREKIPHKMPTARGSKSWWTSLGSSVESDQFSQTWEIIKSNLFWCHGDVSKNCFAHCEKSSFKGILGLFIQAENTKIFKNWSNSIRSLIWAPCSCKQSLHGALWSCLVSSCPENSRLFSIHGRLCHDSSISLSWFLCGQASPTLILSF